MDTITITKENLEQEHICCALANNKDCQVASKKAWLQDCLLDGLVFKKCNVRGKCFIEYIPAEKAWVPIVADAYMYINCFWVAGKFKGQGYSNLLLEACIKDSQFKGKKGLVILSAKKKLPFLSDPDYLFYKGFREADTAGNYVLLYLPFCEDATVPHFKECAKSMHVEDKGFVLYYTRQCPFTAKYVPLVQTIAQARGVQFKTIQLASYEEGQNAPAPCTTYALFYNGNFVTNEILSVKKFEKFLEEKGL